MDGNETFKGNGAPHNPDSVDLIDYQLSDEQIEALSEEARYALGLASESMRHTFASLEELDKAMAAETQLDKDARGRARRKMTGSEERQWMHLEHGEDGYRLSLTGFGRVMLEEAIEEVQ